MSIHYSGSERRVSRSLVRPSTASFSVGLPLCGAVCARLSHPSRTHVNVDPSIRTGRHAIRGVTLLTACLSHLQAKALPSSLDALVDGLAVEPCHRDRLALRVSGLARLPHQATGAH